jgi:DNA processing protein
LTTDAAYHRETCIWLSELATWRPGLINRVCKMYGDLETAILRPRQELALRLAPKRSLSLDPEDESDAVAFRRSLARCAPLRAPTGAHVPVLTYVDQRYPASLRQLHDPPPALYIRCAAPDDLVAARLHVLAEAPKVAVVGSRSCSEYGIEMASAIAADLARKGVVVVSGLAMGADAAAHRGALRVTGGAGAPLPTVAVLGCGADVVYPKINGRVQAAVGRRGLVLSEFVWGTPARGWRFPSRNRIMAALCHAVVVVEGATSSGALITARHAADLGRDVFAVPGEAGRRLSEGPHGLLRAGGATICESADDVMKGLERLQQTDPVAASYLPRDRSGGDQTGRDVASAAAWCLEEEAARAVVRRLDDGPATADELCEASHAPAAAVLALLSALELEGLVRADGGGRYRAVRG